MSKLEKGINSQNLLAVVLILFIFSNVYYQYVTKRKIDTLQQDFNKTSEELMEQVSENAEKVDNSQENTASLADAFGALQNQVSDLSRDFSRVNRNVSELEKITQTDPELLQKYSKVFFLNEHYAPTDLRTIPSNLTYNEERDYEIHSQVYPFLDDLLDEAEDDGLDLQVISAFRSFAEQTQLKGSYTVQYGAGANTFSADQGYSEHQLGTTVDFTTPEVGATFSGFAQTDEYRWLQRNAYKYGFVLSYPENNEYYQFEPWHWRFVGTKLARRLDRDNSYFYDMPQREINEYIGDLFD